MTYSMLNSVFLGLAFWFFVATMAVIGIQMKKRAAAGRSAAEDVDSLVLPTDARRTRDQRSTPSSARRPNLLMKYALTLIVFALLPEYSERIDDEYGPLLRSFAAMLVVSAVAVASFVGELRQRPWRYYASAALLLMLAGGLWSYWPRNSM